MHKKGGVLGKLPSGKKNKLPKTEPVQGELPMTNGNTLSPSCSSAEEQAVAAVVPMPVKTEIAAEALPPSIPGRPNVAAMITEVVTAARGESGVSSVCVGLRRWSTMLDGVWVKG